MNCDCRVEFGYCTTGIEASGWLKPRESANYNSCGFDPSVRKRYAPYGSRWCATRWVASLREWAPPLALANDCSRMACVGHPFRSRLRQS